MSRDLDEVFSMVSDTKLLMYSCFRILTSVIISQACISSSFQDIKIFHVIKI